MVLEYCDLNMLRKKLRHHWESWSTLALVSGEIFTGWFLDSQLPGVDWFAWLYPFKIPTSSLNVLLDWFHRVWLLDDLRLVALDRVGFADLVTKACSGGVSLGKATSLSDSSSSWSDTSNCSELKVAWLMENTVMWSDKDHFGPRLL